MKLRLGQAVTTTDGDFGEVAGIVVDPLTRAVTHLVVQPRRHHFQARLVPIWLVTDEGDSVGISVEAAHVRQFREVADSELIRLGDLIELDDEWDIGTEDVVAAGPIDDDYGLWAYDDHVMVNYDRIPRGECEIRRSSTVEASDDTGLGTVEGFVADDHDRLVGVVVRAGRIGLRHFVVVPVESVARVRTDRIQLSIDPATFRALPVTDDVFGPDHFLPGSNTASGGWLDR